MTMPSHLATLTPFWVMAMLGAVEERRRAGLPVYPLEAGQPAALPPAAVRSEGQRLLGIDKLGYTASAGWQPLREALAAHYHAQYALAVEPAQIIVTPGSSGAFILSFLAAFAPGARVGLAVPGYPAYRNILQSFGRQVVPIPVSSQNGYRLTPQDIEQALPLDGLIVASPANPTGAMQSPESLASIAALAAQHGIRLIADELYHGVTYGTVPTVSMGQYSQSAVLIGSFSKYYAMPGFRLGWLVAPTDLVEPIEALIQNLFLAAPTLPQRLGPLALAARPELDTLVTGYAANRALLLEALPDLGFTALSPADGAFYLYADAGAFTRDSLGFCQRLLAQTGVALAPGLDFDPVRGHRTVRFSYAGAHETIAAAVAILRQTALRNV